MTAEHKVLRVTIENFLEGARSRSGYAGLLTRSTLMQKLTFYGNLKIEQTQTLFGFLAASNEWSQAISTDQAELKDMLFFGQPLSDGSSENHFENSLVTLAVFRESETNLMPEAYALMITKLFPDSYGKNRIVGLTYDLKGRYLTHLSLGIPRDEMNTKFQNWAIKKDHLLDKNEPRKSFAIVTDAMLNLAGTSEDELLLLKLHNGRTNLIKSGLVLDEGFYPTIILQPGSTGTHVGVHTADNKIWEIKVPSSF